MISAVGRSSFYHSLPFFHRRIIMSSKNTASLTTHSSSADTHIVLIGDLHGNLNETKLLWDKLQDRLGSSALDRSTVIFLGDYVDRGPNTRGVLDFLIKLKKERKHDRTRFLCGNHDFGMACYLGCIPTDNIEKVDLDATLNPSYVDGFYPHKVEGGMHYQGRRWGGSDAYYATATFSSYGIPNFLNTVQARTEFMEAVPEAHKEFLRELEWVYDQPIPFLPGRLICTHAGLSSTVPTEDQLRALSQRDLASSILHEKGDIARLTAFHGRANVLDIPNELEGKALVVSGHHGVFVANGDRYIIDESGGWPSAERGIQALILPEHEIVSTCSTSD